MLFLNFCLKVLSQNTPSLDLDAFWRRYFGVMAFMMLVLFLKAHVCAERHRFISDLWMGCVNCAKPFCKRALKLSWCCSIYTVRDTGCERTFIFVAAPAKSLLLELKHVKLKVVKMFFIFSRFVFVIIVLTCLNPLFHHQSCSAQRPSLCCSSVFVLLLNGVLLPLHVFSALVASRNLPSVNLNSVTEPRLSCYYLGLSSVSVPFELGAMYGLA